MKSVIYNGVEYRSLSDACRVAGVPISTAKVRLDKGMSVDEALHKGNYGNAVTVHGKFFSSLQEVLDYYGINRSTLLSRMSKGLSLEEALTYTKYSGIGIRKTIEKEKIVIDGKVFYGKQEVCDFYGIGMRTLYRRLNDGLSIEEAVQSAKYHKSNSLEYAGKRFNSLKDLCDFYGKNYNSVSISVRDKGLSIEEALAKAPNTDSLGFYEVEIGGNKFRSLNEAIKYYGVNKSTFRKRLEKGYTYEEALGLVDVKDRRCRELVVNGHTFKSCKDACIYYGVSMSSIRSYSKRKGCSLEEALIRFINKRK